MKPALVFLLLLLALVVAVLAWFYELLLNYPYEDLCVISFLIQSLEAVARLWASLFTT